MGSIFVAIFAAGIVSLILELSLLREFVYVIGSSAFSNAIIISVFLAGLAIGTYVGTAKRLKIKGERALRIRFAVLELFLLFFIFAFYTTKDFFIYITTSQALVITYFIVATLLPSCIAGYAYTVIVDLLYHKGERYIVYIYAVSTLGNVVGGLLHGYVFVYLFGQQAAYVFSVLCAALAALLIVPGKRMITYMVFIGVSSVIAWVIHTDALNARIYHFRDLLFRKNSPSGLVEIWKTPDNEAIEMTVNNVHEYYSYEWDKNVHKDWADTTLEASGNEVSVLLLGYGSGVSSAQFLASEKVRNVDTVENTVPVLEAGSIYFPREYQSVTTDPRSRIILQDFRNYIRFTEKKYDIVLLDHSIIDPYYSGFFTVEFFDQIKRILTPQGIVASLGVGLSYDTLTASFPYRYTYTAEGKELISDSGYFLTVSPIPDSRSTKFTLQTDEGYGEPIYSDSRIKNNSINTALRAIKPRVSRSLF